MKVRKIAALAVGAAMIGATMGYASAQNNLPGKDFFVKDGAPNVKIVVGSNAAAMDVASAADIAVALGSLLYTSEEVQADGVSVVVKKDVTQYPDPIPVYSSYYADYGTSPSAEDWDKLPTDAWYNGAAYNGTYSDWKNYISSKGYSFEIGDRDSLNDNKMIDWDINITGIKFYKDDKDWSNGYPPKDSDVVLYVPAGDLNVTLNYRLYNATYKYTSTDSIWGTTSTDTKYVIDDDTPSTMDFGGTTYTLDTYKNYTYGIGKGDTFTLLGNKYYVLDVNASAKVPSFSYGKDFGSTWFHVGDTLEYDGYKVTAMDISINEERALFTVTSPDGDTQMVILKRKEETPLFDNGIILTLENTFVGIDGNLIATVKVVTNKKTVNSGDELVSGWNAYLQFGTDADGNDVITSISLVNNDNIQGSTIDILGVYKMDYVVTAKEKDINADGINELAVKSEIDFVPVKKVYDTQELKVGDKIGDTGYIVDQIKGGTYTKVTVMPPAEPITLLDSEVDVNNVTSNLILVGGPVANSVTAYLVDQGLSKVDWTASEGDLEYIENAFGDYDVLIVAGKAREYTKAAAEELMGYLKDLA